jgi:hypothetical protein
MFQKFGTATGCFRKKGKPQMSVERTASTQPQWHDEGAQITGRNAALALLQKAGLRSADKDTFTPDTPEGRAIAALTRGGLTSKIKQELR